MTSNQSGPNERESLVEAASVMPKRRDRLEALKARRAQLEAAGGAAEPPEPASFGEGGGGRQAGGGLGALFQEGGAAGRGGAQRKMIGRVYRMLTQTPDDGSGMVPETPFTNAGVARLMALLGERASGGKGAKVAEKAKEFLTAREGEAATAGGASVEKLQMLARRTEQLRQGRGR